MRDISDRRTDEQLVLAASWSDGPGTATPPGHWCAIAAEHILERRLDDARAADIMGLLCAAMMDAGIACWDAKYAYWSIRPYQADRSIITPIGQPNFPSYVSGHATFSGTASEILASAFPHAAARLRGQAEEAALSRLYGGIHYRFDNERGLSLGRAVAALALADHADGRWTSDLSPLVMVSAPAAGAVLAAAPTILATITDDGLVAPDAVRVLVLNAPGSVFASDVAVSAGPSGSDLLVSIGFAGGLPEGAYVVRITAVDAEGHSGHALASFTVDSTGAPIVVIDSPSDRALFGMSGPVAVRGHVDQAVASCTINGTSISVAADGTFAVDLAVDALSVLRRPMTLTGGLNELLVQALDPAGRVGRARIDVLIDDSPPRVHIETPGADDDIGDEQVTVAGSVEDIVLGTVDTDNVVVTVNGLAAHVRNSAFLVPQVPLAVGANALTVTATDQAGNATTHSIGVVRAAHRGLLVRVLSGDLQEGPAGADLTDPIRIRIEDQVGVALADQAVTIAVTRGDGILAEATDDERRRFTVLSDAAGMVTANWRIGTRAGVGNQRLTVTAAGTAVSAGVLASVAAGPIDAVYVAAGDQQTAAVGSQLPQPLVAWASDAAGNPITGHVLRFLISSDTGGLTTTSASSVWSTSVNVTTDADGRATAYLRLGSVAGIDVARVIVDSPGHVAHSASFGASAVVSTGQSKDTAVSGIVMSTEHEPIEGVTVVIEGSTIGAVSDAHGAFRIRGAPAGHRHLSINGTTANAGRIRYPTIGFEVDLALGAEIRLPMPIYLPRMDLANEALAGDDAEVILPLPGVNGAEIVIAPRSTIRADGTRGPVWMYTSPVNAQAVPMPPPNGFMPPIAATLQPSGTRLDPPARVRWPNMQGLRPGAQTRMMSFDHDLGQFVSQGTMTVTEDGAYLLTDLGSGLLKAGWHFPDGSPVPANDCNGKIKPKVIEITALFHDLPIKAWAGKIARVNLTAVTDIAPRNPGDITWTCTSGHFDNDRQSTFGRTVNWFSDPTYASVAADDIIITASAARGSAKTTATARQLWRGPRVENIAFIMPFAVTQPLLKDILAAYTAKYGEAPTNARILGIVAATEGLAMSMNKVPPLNFTDESLDAFFRSKDFRQIQVLQLEFITLGGKIEDYMGTAHRFDDGYTLVGNPDGAHKYFDSEGRDPGGSKGSRTDDTIEVIFRRESRLSPAFDLISWNTAKADVPWVWNETHYTVRADGSYTISLAGSFFPTHHGYVDDEVVWTQAEGSLPRWMYGVGHGAVPEAGAESPREFNGTCEKATPE
ncbi:MAG: phosphatase PAP2 family protein [Planctomycetes bacterium]|nr:phosphatase PAP2 family protein [Planctomycetota bacterium]